jgi:hypothetical protein
VKRVSNQDSSLIEACFQHEFLKRHKDAAHSILVEILEGDILEKGIIGDFSRQILRIPGRVSRDSGMDGDFGSFDKNEPIELAILTARTQKRPALVVAFEAFIIRNSLDTL